METSLSFIKKTTIALACVILLSSCSTTELPNIELQTVTDKYVLNNLYGLYDYMSDSSEYIRTYNKEESVRQFTLIVGNTFQEKADAVKEMYIDRYNKEPLGELFLTETGTIHIFDLKKVPINIMDATVLYLNNITTASLHSGEMVSFGTQTMDEDLATPLNAIQNDLLELNTSFTGEWFKQHNLMDKMFYF